MNQIQYIFLLFCILFLLEKKAINILLSFVAIIITTAFILPLMIKNYSSNLSLIIESEYFSYALILVQVSALTILFGFIIMLFPNLTQSNSQTSKNLLLNLQNKPIFRGVKIIISLIIIIILFYLLRFNFLPNNYESFNYLKDGILDYKITDFNTLFLRKLGILFYSVEGYIIKLLVLTIILLLAIISLFFIIL